MKPMIWLRLTLFCTLVAAVFLAAVSNTGAQSWQLVWSDEFDGPENSAPDPAKWNFDVGGHGWGNNELEYYTNRRDNSFIDGLGNLVIRSVKENYTGSDGVTRNYTSARLLTAGKFTQRFGRFEARIKLPSGQGIWPAFWMLGSNIGSAGWPGCGEIDIMENIGREPSTAHGSLHGPGYSGGNSITGMYLLNDGQRFADDFHVFTVDWEPNVINFYVDGVLYQTRTPADVPTGGTWVFDHPFFLILNVAVGGNWPGNPNQTTTFPQTMLVDYVRVYADQDLANKQVLIASAIISGKHVIVSGEGFADGAIILMEDVERRTNVISSSRLKGVKLAKKIAVGQNVTIQVRNPDGTLSNTVSLLRR